MSFGGCGLIVAAEVGVQKADRRELRDEGNEQNPVPSLAVLGLPAKNQPAKCSSQKTHTQVLRCFHEPVKKYLGDLTSYFLDPTVPLLIPRATPGCGDVSFNNH